VRFFRRLNGYPAPVMSVGDALGEVTVSLIRRVSFTVIGIVMVLWSLTILSAQASAFPSVDIVSLFVGIFTLILGIRNALSLFKDVTWGQAFLTIAFVILMAYFVWFA